MSKIVSWALKISILILSSIFVIFSIWIFLNEIEIAILKFHFYSKTNEYIGVIASDLVTTSNIFFGILIIYGSIKEIPKFVYLGVLINGYYILWSFYFFVDIYFNVKFKILYIKRTFATLIFHLVFLVVAFCQHKRIHQQNKNKGKFQLENRSESENS